MENIHNWNNFVKECSDYILPIYEKHEKTFDVNGIHGRLHISRAIIFGEYMARFYHNLGIKIDFTAIRYAIAFHDSGREGNGIDLWEKDSAKLCFNYLSKKYDSDYCKYVSSLIIKNKNLYDDNKYIVQDADVLEIMRPICGHGERDGFNPNYFSFLKNIEEYKDIRNNLIEDAWEFIEYTEGHKDMYNNPLYQMIEIAEKFI